METIEMGMIGCFAPVPTETLNQLLSDPESIEDYLYPNDGDDEPPNYFDVDKAWHGIHYLVTGQAYGGAYPLSLATTGGEEFGPEIGYGPARFLTASQVVEVSEAISSLTVDVLNHRFNPQDMEAKKIYPDVIWVRDGQESLEYLLEHFEGLVGLYRDAASRGDCMLQWLS
jgi:Domain of unknown function (DUF1877)